MGMSQKYKFKRQIFTDTRNAIANHKVFFLLGPKKCGKTICMKQIASEYENAFYIDVKSSFETEADKRNFISRILSDIKEDKNILYLIDESIYLPCPDKDIARIAEAFTDADNCSTRIVFAGNPSKALGQWGHIAFAGNAAFIEGYFLFYPEWLAYKKTTEVSEKTYIDFISHAKEFYRDFDNTKDYLESCLNETIISNNRALEYVIGNDTGDINTEMLMDTLYASMMPLYNHTACRTFQDQKQLAKTIADQFPIKYFGITDEELSKTISDFLCCRYNNFKHMSTEDCKKSLQFLSSCGLITITPLTDDPDSLDPYITEKLLKDSNDLFNKNEIFTKYIITMNYPMFYMDMVQSILSKDISDIIPPALLRNIVECHIRSLMSNTGCFKYCDEDGTEIDYVNISGFALECSLSNNITDTVHFDVIPGLREKILLTKNQTLTANGITGIPYSRFIFEQSGSKTAY